MGDPYPTFLLIICLFFFGGGALVARRVRKTKALTGSGFRPRVLVDFGILVALLISYTLKP